MNEKELVKQVNEFLDNQLRRIIRKKLDALFRDESNVIWEEIDRRFKKEMRNLLRNSFDSGLNEGVNLKERINKIKRKNG